MSSKKDILKRITSIRNRGARMDRDIHETGVLCLEHARDHGDVTLATKLVDAMPKSSRRKALIAWFTNHGPMRYSAKNEQFTLKKQRQPSDFLVDEANTVPFWEFTKERTPAKYDLEKAINGFVRSLRKAREQGNLDVSRDTVESRLREALNTEMA